MKDKEGKRKRYSFIVCGHDHQMSKQLRMSYSLQLKYAKLFLYKYLDIPRHAGFTL